MLHIEVPEKTRRGLRPFVMLPFSLYREDENWVPPLLHYQYRQLLGRENALLNESECRFFLLYEGDKPVGRVLAGVDRRLNERLHQNTGYFSLFECEDGLEKAQMLLDTACDYLRSLNVEKVIGPTPPTVDDFGKGVLVQGFDGMPVFLNPYNPPYYAQLLTACGFTKHRDHLAYYMRLEDFDMDKLDPIVQRAKRRFGFEVRHVRFTRANGQKLLADITRVIREAFPPEWEINLPTQEDIRREFSLARHFYRPEMTIMAYAGARPIGVVVAFPDYNPLIKKAGGRLSPLGFARLAIGKNKVRGARCAMQFVVPEYQNMAVNTAMFCEAVEASRAIGIQWVEGSTVDETNAVSINNTERAGAKLYRVYRQYEKNL